MMEIVMPQLGETVSEGTLTIWHKSVGDEVTANEVLFEIGTDKVEMEVPAPTSGVLKEIRVDAGETVGVGTILAVIDDGSAPAAAETPAAKVAPAAAPAQPQRQSAPSRDKSLKLSPVVRKLLAENNLQPGQITGTGRDGRIKRGDVLAFLKGTPAAPAARPTPMPASSGDGRTVVPFNRRRQMTAEHMVRSKATSAHVLQAVEVDFSNVDAARKRAGSKWKAKEGFSLSYLPFIAKAVCDAIAEFPKINAHVEGENLVAFDAVNLAIAVDLDFEGLVAPVVRDAGSMAVVDLARAINDIAARARRDALGPDDFQGATYTISNNGTFGTLITAPIINQPQVAILSTDAVIKKPVAVVVDGTDAVAVRPVGVLAQSFDHRAIDGAYSAAFLRRLKDIIETREWAAAVP
ncbi:MAG: 2-oxo acid dehydrogenase subunit E2 [Rhodospirillaceae bacterium]|nr:2-oxo acid dehydrogenase subunit E2 [Rhodospirillaceae bacterium]MBT3884766.1 2-oxo acid dehydrogenase subunit E2 [Rhodospirillaceae bacterium]MBT4673606.1 2-oxo acid dehydrogenase subunit E2 [Rhodospirillaceae bacterium]MBT4718284.1 2-oxo acid dehydrogenase subunit E2 [Rhodospirillaceae bacterium]MBT5179608.1 2-oxo acid dehydrogenase subunit E2 [Rhodospirillaceae bacterium]